MTNFRHCRSAVDDIYLYPCWWPTIFLITRQCWLGLRLHYPAAPIASTPYDMSGSCYHRMVVARAEYLFSAKVWRELNLLTMYLRVLHKQRKISPSFLLNPTVQIWSKNQNCERARSIMWQSQIQTYHEWLEWEQWSSRHKLHSSSTALRICATPHNHKNVE